MSNTGMKVRVFDMAHGLVEYEDVKTIRIIIWEELRIKFMKR